MSQFPSAAHLASWPGQCPGNDRSAGKPIWHMLKTGEIYTDLGPDHLARRNPKRQTKRLLAQLQRLGHTVTLHKAPA